MAQKETHRRRNAFIEVSQPLNHYPHEQSLPTTVDQLSPLPSAPAFNTGTIPAYTTY